MSIEQQTIEQRCTEETFSQIRSLVDAACQFESRRRRSKRIEEAINWADLSCRWVEWVETDDGQRFYRAVVQEAAPGCSKLCAAIKEYVQGHMPETPIEVVTEW